MILKIGLQIILSIAINISYASNVSIVSQPIKIKTLDGNILMPNEVTFEYSSEC